LLLLRIALQRNIFALNDLREGIAFVPATLLGNDTGSQLDPFIKAWMPGLDNKTINQIKEQYAVDDYPAEYNTFRRAEAVS
jgi:hypothetical protein